jgi:chorismate dehydratase
MASPLFYPGDQSARPWCFSALPSRTARPWRKASEGSVVESQGHTAFLSARSSWLGCCRRDANASDGAGEPRILCRIFDSVKFTGFARSGRFRDKACLPGPKSGLLYLSFRERTANLPKLRISIVQYLNTAPLVWGFTNGPLRGKYELSFTVPSLCAEALRSRAADIAIIPAIEYQRMGDLVILPDMAIASQNQVRSLLIISKMPIEEARSIALDSSSRSTQALTKILCHRWWKIAPEFLETPPDAVAMLHGADAALLIGDPALRLSIEIQDSAKRGAAGEQVSSGNDAGIPDAGTVHVYDVVEEWRKMTNLPAVLAVWAARSEVVNAEVIEDFQTSRDFGLQNVEEISQRAARDLHLPAGELKRYLTENIDFRLGEENLRGLTAYFRFASTLGLIPQMNTMAIAAARNKPLRYVDFALAKER